MINIFWAKRWVGFVLLAVLPLFLFISLVFAGFDLLLSTAVAVLLVVPLGMLVRRFFLAHPLIDYLEGKGLIVKTLDSTGVIKTFLVELQPPFLRGKVNEKEIEDVFDRNAMIHETYPMRVSGTVDENGDIVIRIPASSVPKLQFREHVYPVFIWNENLKTFLTKESIAKLETDTLLDHALLYLVRKIEELDSHLRDFARYVVDMTKPRFSLLEMLKNNPLVWILIVGMIVLMAVFFFMPELIQGIFPQPATATPPQTTGVEGAVTPKG